MSNNYEPFVVSVAAVNQSFDARNAFRFRVMLLVLFIFSLASSGACYQKQVSRSRDLRPMHTTLETLNTSRKSDVALLVASSGYLKTANLMI